jgi:hypothetical protein
MRYCLQFPGGIPHQEVDNPRVTHPYATLLRIAPFLVRLACVKRAASVDSEPGSNSRLNLLFWMAQPDITARPDRSPQFELKLLTKFLLRIQPDCQTSAHETHDHFSTETCGFAKADYMPASKAVRPQQKRPWTRIQPVTGQFYYNQKYWESERTSSEKGAIGTSVGNYFLYRVLLPTLP